MSHSTREEARGHFFDRLQRTVSCLTPAVLRRGPVTPRWPESWSFTNNPVPLQGVSRLTFSMIHSYEFTGGQDDADSWEIATKGYSYTLSQQDGREVIAFHWHPNNRGQADFPHIHVIHPLGASIIHRKQHIPTGRVSLESVVRFAIVELGARPVRPDWERVLDAGQAEFGARRSW
ncbi:MAG: hypothetical protein M3464_05650 [Chloroflexota bacterium]|nr:hypothetical protein [Chloroflexota bacterium]